MRQQRVVQFVGIADNRPRLAAHLADRLRIESRQNPAMPSPTNRCTPSTPANTAPMAKRISGTVIEGGDS